MHGWYPDMSERKRTITRRVIPPEPAEPQPFAKEIMVYTDGCCAPSNPGPGGWAWVCPPGQLCNSGAGGWSTNQRMELTAVIEALGELVMFSRPVIVFTDSQYITNCFRDQWYIRWQSNGWRNAQRQPVANEDLWRRLLPLTLEHHVEFRWVKGHAGNRWNEVADQMAGKAI